MQLLVMFAVALAMLIVYAIIAAVLSVVGVDTTSVGNLLWIETLSQALIFLVPVICVTSLYYRGRQREYYRLDFSGRGWLYALAGAVIMLLLVPFIDWLTTWNDSWNLGLMGEKLRALQDMTEGIMESMLGTTTVGGMLVNLVVVALMPALCEEVFFRAGIQNLLQRWFTGDYESDRVNGKLALGTHVAIWVTAMIFSLVHGEIFSFMPRLVMGVLLGYLYVCSGSILVNIAAHFVNNALIVVLYWLYLNGQSPIDPDVPLDLGWLTIACCLLAALMLFYTTFVMKRSRGGVKKME